MNFPLYFPHFHVNSLDLSSTPLPYHTFHYYYYQVKFGGTSRFLLWLINDSIKFLLIFIMNKIPQELSCRSFLYIFEISCLSVASFAIIFSHSEGCLFTLLIVSFDVKKLLRLIRSHLFIFYFISNILGGGSYFFLLSFLPQVSRLESSLWYLLPPPQQISHTPYRTLASASQKTQTKALTNTLQTILFVGRYPMESWTGTPGDCTRIHECRHSKWNKLMFWPHLLCFSCLTYETI